MSDLVLVTGASGFVGSAVARKLASRDFRVRVLVRATSPRTNLVDFPHEIVEGDMRDRASMNRAAQGVRYLFHVAADYRLWARDPDDIVRNNLEGTRATMQAALDAHVERVVYTSSVATLKPLACNPADETSRHDEKSAIGAYKRSKVVAERLDREWAATPARVHAIEEYYQASEAGFAQSLKSKGYREDEIGTHAGLADTSLMLGADSHLVRTDRLRPGSKPEAGDGVNGDPRRASAELGQFGIDLIVTRTVEAITKVTARR